MLLKAVESRIVSYLPDASFGRFVCCADAAVEITKSKKKIFLKPMAYLVRIKDLYGSPMQYKGLQQRIVQTVKQKLQLSRCVTST